MKVQLAFFSILCCCMACNDHHPDTEKIIEQLHAREPKRVTPGQIITLTQDLGRTITNQASTHWNNNVKTDSVQLFSQDLIPSFHDSLGQFELALITKPGQANKEEAELFSAYQFSKDHVSSDMDNVQDVKTEGYLLYNRPFMVSDTFYGMWSVTYKKGEIVRLYPAP